MQEKISLTVLKEQSADDAVRILREAGFPPVGEPVALCGGDESHRSIAFLVQPSEEARALATNLGSLLGVIRCTTAEANNLLRINVTYNCEILKGR